MKHLPILSTLLFNINAYALPHSGWQELAKSLGEKLVLNIRPPAAPCHKHSYNASQCKLVVSQWKNSTWRSNQIGAMQFTTWEQLNGHWCDIAVDDQTGDPTNFTDPIVSACSQGNIPKIGVNASSPEDISIAVKFANEFSVPLVIKGTGHDFLGRSTDPNRLLIWTHHMKNINYGTSNICGTAFEDTITVSAGVQWGEAYHALAKHQRVVPGDAELDVGASGGQVQCGGNSPLSNTYGLTPDSVIQFKVVTLDGVQRTVNRCSYPDLFWALRGGGGGTYAIVTSTTYKTYADAPTAYAYFAYNDTPTSFPMVLDHFARYSPGMAEFGWTGYVFGINGVSSAVFFLPLVNNITFQAATESFNPLISSLNDTEGLSYLNSGVTQYPSMQSYLSSTAVPLNTGFSAILGSRLIPKSLFKNPASRTNIANLSAAIRNDSLGIYVYALMLSGGAASKDADNAVLPAWRKAIWHTIFSLPVPVDGTRPEIDQAFQAVTSRLEPLRKATPGSGAYMNEADARAPAWKEDFFGENYEKLLAIKKRWDPKGLLRCNRCVGSDL